MNNLIGSEKQITWATDILTALYDSAIKYTDNMNEDIVDNDGEADTILYYDGKQELLDTFINEVETHTNASNIIEFRNDAYRPILPRDVKERPINRRLKQFKIYATL